MIIRKAKKEDSDKICEIIHKTFMEFVASDFTKEGIIFYLKGLDSKYIAEEIEGGAIFVAEINEEVVGMISGNKKDKITGLFVDRL